MHMPLFTYYRFQSKEFFFSEPIRPRDKEPASLEELRNVLREGMPPDEVGDPLCIVGDSDPPSFVFYTIYKSYPELVDLEPDDTDYSDEDHLSCGCCSCCVCTCDDLCVCTCDDFYDRKRYTNDIFEYYLYSDVYLYTHDKADDGYRGYLLISKDGENWVYDDGVSPSIMSWDDGLLFLYNNLIDVGEYPDATGESTGRNWSDFLRDTQSRSLVHFE